MSDRSAVMESGNPVDPLQTALKRVYSIHKEKLKELGDERDDFKDGCEILLQHKNRLLEKARSLQNQNEVLCNENTRLRNLLESVRTQDGRGSRCETCDHLQRSLSAIQEAYKHSLDEKEKMIHYLEERVAELSRHSSPFSKQQDLNLSGLLTPDKSINDGETARASRRKSPLLKEEEENVASKKILEAVSQRLGRESTQDDHVLSENKQQRRPKIKESNERSKEKDMQFDDSGYFGKSSLRNKDGAMSHSCTSSEMKYDTSHNMTSQKHGNMTNYDNRTVKHDTKSDVDKLRGHRHTEKNDTGDRNNTRDEKMNPAYPSEKSGTREEHGDKESPETQRLRKLGLGRKPGKRSRYTEDSPTNKKAKLDKSPIQTSDDSDAPAVISTRSRPGDIDSDKTVSRSPVKGKGRKLQMHDSHSSKSRVLVQDTCNIDSDKTMSMGSDGSPVNWMRQKGKGLNNRPSKPRVLVQETCDIDSDRTVSMSSEGSPVSWRRRRDSVPDSHYPDYAVVPETLGMGVTSDESESEDNTQNTVKARSEKGSPGQVLHSPPSGEESDNELDDVGLKKAGKGGLVMKSLKNVRHIDNPKGAVTTDNDSSEKKRNSGGFDNDNECRPSSPVFSGVRGARANTESPFLFDDDRPGSSKLDRRRSMNVSCLTSDQESPLLLKPVTDVSNNCGQSPLLKEKVSKIDNHNSRHTSIQVSGNNSDQESPLLLKPVGLRSLTKDSGQSPVLEKRSNRLEVDRQEVSCITDTESNRTRSSQDRAQRMVRSRNSRMSERLKQTTLSQAFTSSPPTSPYVNVSPTKPEEREAIDRAIRLSLQEIHNKDVVKTKKPLFGKGKGKNLDSELTENVPPLFKKPPSPSSLISPSKRKSPNKKSTMKEKTKKLSQSKNKTQTEIVDLDETVPPDTETLQAFTRQYTPGKGEITGGMLNQSIDPDISLTQYCSDTELLSQRHRTRSSRSVNSLSQDFNSQSRGRKKGGKISKQAKDNGNKSQTDSIKSKDKHSTYQNDSEMTIRSDVTSALTPFTPNDGVSLGGDVCVVSSGESRTSSSVEMRSCGQSQDLQEEEEEGVADVTLDPKFMRAHMFEGQLEESQSIPLSSCSFKFGSTKSKPDSSQHIDNGPLLEDAESSEEENTMTMEGQRRKSLDDSFDRVPRKGSVDYAHVEVVRKKAERKQLKATTCKECYDYYKSKGLSEEEIAEQIQDCSRHRARHLPPSTPEHFWSIGFPDTQECVQRGYIGVESPSKRKPGYRRRRKLAMRFNARQDEEDDD